jgi:CDP-diacylglycerol--glycerol-3-phosphate 3-phosphatidyltransferase
MTQESVSRQGIWRHIPNAISIARLCAAPVLLASLFLRQVDLFRWLLLACLLSDILDGLIARGFHLTSPLGATLDSIADILTMLLGLLGIVVFQRNFVAAHSTQLLLVALLYVAEIAASLWRYRKVSSFHTLFSRIAAYSAGIFFMSLFFWGYHAWLFYTAMGIYVVALCEEMLLISLLPQWSSDVGGLYRLLSKRGSDHWKSPHHPTEVE